MHRRFPQKTSLGSSSNSFKQDLKPQVENLRPDLELYIQLVFDYSGVAEYNSGQEKVDLLSRQLKILEEDILPRKEDEVSKDVPSCTKEDRVSLSIVDRKH